MSTNDSAAVAKSASSNHQQVQVGKQWWKVCFLYGNQEKYYRQIYAKAASERIAQSQHQQNGSGPTQRKSAIIFPTKQHRPILLNGGGQKKDSDTDRPAPAVKKRVTVLDDSFLLGVSEDEQRSDSGINIDASNQPDEPPAVANRGMRRNFHLSSEELRLLNSDKPLLSGGHFAQSSTPPVPTTPGVMAAAPNSSPIVMNPTGSSGNSQIARNSSPPSSSSPTAMADSPRPDVLVPTNPSNK